MLRRSFRLLKQSSWLLSCNLRLHLAAFQAIPSKSGNDLPNPKMPTPLTKLHSPDTDILLEELKNAKSITKVMELTSMHLDVMNNRHVIACLESIFEDAKNDSEKAQYLLSNATFQALCSRLMKLVRLFDPQEVITSYKVLINLGIRNNTYLMQSILKMIGAHLNNMSLGQLNFLNFLLHKQRHNSLVDGLRLALPLVLQVQIDQQLDSDNITDIVNVLQLCCRSRLRTSTIQKVVSAAKKKASAMSLSDAVTVTFALLNLETPVDGYRELLDAALQVVSSQIEQANPDKLLQILRMCRSQRYYHGPFFTAVANCAVQKKWSLELIYSMLTTFYQMQFFPLSLINRFAELLISEKSDFYNGKFSALNCVEYLTATSQKPTYANEAARVISSDVAKLQSVTSMSPYLAVKLFSYLATLGCFPKEWLTRILEEDFLFDALSVSRKQGRVAVCENAILAFKWSLELYDKSNEYSIPSSVLQKIMQFMYKKSSQCDYPLEKFMINGLGGQQFLQTGVFTRDGHFINHVVAMRSGYYPVSFQSTSKSQEENLLNLVFAEDIVIPEDAKIVTILVATEGKYFKEPEVLNGWMDLKVKSLSKKGYLPVVINYKIWSDLPDREKIPYLMREIKDAVIYSDSALYSTNFS